MATVVRVILLAAYGAAGGVAYAALICLAVPASRIEVAVLGVILSAFFGFLGWGVVNAPEWSNFQRLGFLTLWPVSLIAGGAVMLVVCVAVALLAPVVIVERIVEERRFRNQMASKGRFIPFDKLRPRLEAGEGTLIEEIGLRGPCHIWWTEDDLTTKGRPVSTDEEFAAVVRGEEHAFNTQCLREYLDIETGRAFLTSIARRYGRSGLTRKFPRMSIVMVVRPYSLRLG